MGIGEACSPPHLPAVYVCVWGGSEAGAGEGGAFSRPSASLLLALSLLASGPPFDVSSQVPRPGSVAG